MDYNIYPNTLLLYLEQLNEVKNHIKDFYNEYENSYINSLSSSVLSKKCNDVKNSITRINNGAERVYEWLNDYQLDLINLETNLANFKATMVESPLDFLGNFTNPFAKKTIPTLQTGGDKNSNVNSLTTEISQEKSTITISNNTQAQELYELGKAANNGDEAAKKQFINTILPMVMNTTAKTGYNPVVLLSQIINESGWMTTDLAKNHNNVLGINNYIVDYDGTVWNGESVSKSVPQEVNGTWVYGNEDMAKFSSLEQCIYDFSYAYPRKYNKTNIIENPSVDSVLDTVKGYATDSSYRSKLRKIIDSNNLIDIVNNYESTHNTGSNIKNYY